ncbi:hypothetical protein LEP1GSC051_2283 [Leptospira sp. P2653]|nr:hypothetical protein LEP1GSC051_2283 [Leptospira sp. P2653]
MKNGTYSALVRDLFGTYRFSNCTCSEHIRNLFGKYTELKNKRRVKIALK